MISRLIKLLLFIPILANAAEDCPAQLEVVASYEYKKSGVGKTLLFEAEGCIAHSVARTWEVTKQKKFMRHIGTQTLSLNSLPTTENIHAAFETVEEGCLSVGPIRGCAQWTMNWLHSVAEGPLEDPEVVQIRVKKVSGSSAIDLWESLIELRRRDDGATQFFTRLEVKATGASLKKIRKGVEREYRHILLNSGDSH